MAKITTALFGELAILPREAEAPVKETWDFLTDVMQSFDGSEQRLQLRTKPRVTFGYGVPLQAWHVAAAFNTEYGAIRKRWAVPVWTEAQYVGTVTDHATSIACDTTLHDLRTNSLALLYAGCDKWQIVEIGTITGTSINVTNDLSYMAGCYLMPVRLGFVTGNIDKPTSGNNGRSELTFQIDDNPFLTPAAPPQYLSQDIYYEPSLLSNGTAAKTLSKREDIVDYDLGPISRRSPWNFAQYATPYRSILTTPAEVRTYKNFLFRRAGKFRPFWMPTQEINMRVANVGTVISTLLIESDSYLDYAGRTNIVVKTTAGVYLPRVVSSPVQVAGGRIQLNLSAPLNLPAEQIAAVSYLGLHRLDSDKVELSWGNNGVVEANVNILEISP